MPAFQTIILQRLEPRNRIWARKHIYCVFKTCTDARRHCKERRGRGFPSSTHHSQNNVKSCWTTKMRGEEAVLLASPAGSAQTGTGRQGKGSTQTAVWLSWAQPWGVKGSAKPRGCVGWMGKSWLGKQSFLRLAWGSEIRPFFFFLERSNSSWLHGSDSCYKWKAEEGGKRLNMYIKFKYRHLTFVKN